MEKYLFRQIKEGKVDYNTVIKKFPQLKSKIDALLKENGYIIVDNQCVKNN